MKTPAQIFRFVLGIALVSTIVLPLFPKKVHSFLYGNKLDVNALNEKAKVQQQNLETTERTLGVNNTDTAAAMDALADTYIDLGEKELAVPLLERALNIRQKVLGKEHRRTVATLAKLAEAYSDLKSYDLALPLQLEALALSEKVFGESHSQTGSILYNLSVTQIALGRYKDAVPVLERSLAIYEKENGRDGPDTLIVMRGLAKVYAANSQNEKSVELYEEILKTSVLSDEIIAQVDSEFVTTLMNLAGHYIAIGNYDAALPPAIRALDFAERTFGKSNELTLRAMNNLSAVYTYRGDYKDAMPLISKVLEVLRQRDGEQSLSTATAMNALGTLYIHASQFDKALSLLKTSLAIHEELQGVNGLGTADTLIGIGGIYLELGQADKALPLLRRAADSREQKLGIVHKDTAEALRVMGSAFVELKQYPKAKAALIRSVEIYTNALGPNHPDTTSAQTQLAQLYLMNAKVDPTLAQHALVLMQQVLSSREKTPGLNPKYLGSALSMIATAYVMSGRAHEAIPIYLRVLEIYSKSIGQNHPEFAPQLNLLAIALLKEGNPDMAVGLLKMVVNSIQEQRTSIANIGKSEVKSYTNKVEYVFQILAALLVDEGRLDEADLVLDMLKEDENFKILRGSSATDLKKTIISFNSSELKWIDKYKSIVSRVSTLGAEQEEIQKNSKNSPSSRDKSRLIAIDQEIKVAQTTLDSIFQDRSQQRTRKMADESLDKNSQSDTQKIVSNLGPETALLRYFVTDEKVGFILTTPKRRVARTLNINGTDFNRKVNEFRRQLRDRNSNPLPNAKALYQLLVAPIALELDKSGSKTIMLSLDGVLRYLPFAALHDGKQFILHRWRMPMFTSVTRSRIFDPVTPHWKGVGLGVTRSHGKFDALPFVRVEMDNIFKGNASTLSGEVYLDDAFTSQRMKEVGQRKFQLVHISSHFEFSSNTEVDSFLLLGDGQHLSLREMRAQNYRFDNVDLLTLSACNTGRGGDRDDDGHEIEGFGVVAQQQGAKAVLATLWSVDDQSTAALMGSFYRIRQEKNLSKIDGLVQAQIALSEQKRYAHPFFWAPFILMGNWK
jgi:CHAT domain-containing protein/tetratricopeptide (TPR) repeat protein